MSGYADARGWAVGNRARVTVEAGAQSAWAATLSEVPRYDGAYKSDGIAVAGGSEWAFSPQAMRIYRARLHGDRVGESLA